MSGIYAGDLSVTIAWIYHYVGRCAFTVYTILLSEGFAIPWYFMKIISNLH